MPKQENMRHMLRKVVSCCLTEGLSTGVGVGSGMVEGQAGVGFGKLG